MTSVAQKTAPFSLHTRLNPIPVAFFAAALLLDCVYSQVGAGARVAFWLISIGLVLSGLSVIFGCADLLRDRHLLQRPGAGVYVSGIVTAYGIEFVNWCGRYFEGKSAVIPMGVELSAFAVVIFAFTIWTGWKMKQG